MKQVSRQPHLTRLTDPRLFAVGIASGGTLENVEYDPAPNRITFCLSGLSPTFVQDCFSNKLTIPVTPFLDALERAYGLITQYKTQGGRR